MTFVKVFDGRPIFFDNFIKFSDTSLFTVVERCVSKSFVAIGEAKPIVMPVKNNQIFVLKTYKETKDYDQKCTKRCT